MHKNPEKSSRKILNKQIQQEAEAAQDMGDDQNQADEDIHSDSEEVNLGDFADIYNLYADDEEERDRSSRKRKHSES